MVNHTAYPNLAADLEARKARSGDQLHQRRRAGRRSAAGAEEVVASEDHQRHRQPHPDRRNQCRVGQRGATFGATDSPQPRGAGTKSQKFRLNLVARRKMEETRLREMEEDPEWQARLRRAEEEEQQLWEEPSCPPTPRYVAEPWVSPQEEADVRADGLAAGGRRCDHPYRKARRFLPGRHHRRNLIRHHNRRGAAGNLPGGDPRGRPSRGSNGRRR
ncbi:uncharacterized protein LOC127010737 [Drosophila biarmipes]|uniref:uncharacterized protein LOC127010737 n=1 Tax=Drosophila biarmipes TaxID=125945 RepID=UPI0021CC7FCB|nr:uncharacterized protein LOC127010737 [Drosophila biarmipes]